jgi:hypothetical protein
MSEKYTTQIWAVLPDGENTITAAVGPWLSLLEFPVDESGQTVYPYKIRDEDGHTDRGTTKGSTALKRAATGADRITLDTVGIDGQERNDIRYRDLRIRVTVWSDSAGWPEGAVSCLELSTRQFTENGTDTGDVESGVLDQLLELAARSHREMNAIYSYGNSVIEARPIENHPRRSAIESGDVTQLAVEWLQILPPTVVTDLGREALATGAWRFEELESGAALVVVDEDPRWEPPERSLSLKQFFS